MNPEITKNTSTPSHPNSPVARIQDPSGRMFPRTVRWYHATASAASPRSGSISSMRARSPARFTDAFPLCIAIAPVHIPHGSRDLRNPRS